MMVQVPTIEQIDALGTLLERVVPPEWEDLNGHVNVRHYLDLYNEAGDGMLAQLGVDQDYFRTERRGFFDLEHHVWYLAEMHVGDRVTVHMRYIARSAKRFHGVVFVVNRTRASVASVLEYVASGADLTTRRSAPFPSRVSEKLDAIVAAHAALEWAAPVSGSMRA
jgi:acyl-CoA thioester hydrolase